jgi:UDP-N-acetylglucosamine 1-carboxyvinyltransferase
MATSGTNENIRCVVEGGRRLSGTIEPSGSKNAALPIIAATLLTDQPVRLSNVPRIRDTEILCRSDPIGWSDGDLHPQR